MGLAPIGNRWTPSFLPTSVHRCTMIIVAIIRGRRDMSSVEWVIVLIVAALPLLAMILGGMEFGK